MQNSNKTIYKNAVFLNVKMVITIVVTLLSTRIILNTLGAEDFGIYNVVASLVVFFLLFNNTLTSSSQRHFSIALSSNNSNIISDTFNASFRVHLIFSFFFLIIASFVGISVINKFLNISSERTEAAVTLYYFVIIVCAINILETPFKSIIYAKEDMHVTALQGIFDAISKLIIAFSLAAVSYDKLMSYGFFLLLLALCNASIFFFYSMLKYKDLRIKRTSINKCLYKELVSFAGWTTFGAVISLIRYQYVAVAINIFVGTIANSALGIANQIGNQISRVNQNITSAYNPQIVKSYGSNELSRTHSLTIMGNKLALFLSLIVALPLWMEMSTVLSIWLKDVPPYTMTFSRVVVFNAILDSLIGSLIITIQATGQIKKYQIVSGLTFLLNIPIIYFLLKMGFPAYSVLISNITFTIIVGCIRLYYLKRMINFPVKLWLNNVLFTNIKAIILPIILTILFHIYIEQVYLRLATVVIVGVVSYIGSFYVFGLAFNEKVQVLNYCQKKLKWLK